MKIDRKFPRLNLSCDVEYSIEDESSAAHQGKENSTTKDISIGGLCFITYKELPLGTTLQLKFRLGNEDKPLILKGKTVWSEAFDIGGSKGWDNGIEFIDIPENDKYRILKYIDSRL